MAQAKEFMFPAFGRELLDSLEAIPFAVLSHGGEGWALVKCDGPQSMWSGWDRLKTKGPCVAVNYGLICQTNERKPI
jgi:hypothetical protein